MDGNWVNIPDRLRSSIEYLVEATRSNKAAIEELKQKSSQLNVNLGFRFTTLQELMDRKLSSGLERMQEAFAKVTLKSRAQKERLSELRTSQEETRKALAQQILSTKNSLTTTFESIKTLHFNLLHQKEKNLLNFFDRRMERQEELEAAFESAKKDLQHTTDALEKKLLTHTRDVAEQVRAQDRLTATLRLQQSQLQASLDSHKEQLEANHSRINYVSEHTASLAEQDTALQADLEAFKQSVTPLWEVQDAYVGELSSLETKLEEAHADLVKRIEVEHMLLDNHKDFTKFFVKSQIQKILSESQTLAQFDKFEIEVEDQPAIDSKLFAIESRIRAAEDSRLAKTSKLPKDTSRRTLRVYEKINRMAPSASTKTARLVGDWLLSESLEHNLSAPKIVQKVVRPRINRPQTADAPRSGVIGRGLRSAEAGN